MDELAYIRPPSALARILKKTAELKFDLASETRTGALLRTLAASKPGGRFLELGTGTGVATAWIQEGMDNESRLISVDVDNRLQDVAREALGSDTRLTLTLEDALAFLRSQPDESFDFVFADALAGKYDGLEQALRVVKRGGFYIIDDMLPQPAWPEGHAEKVTPLLGAMAAHQEFEITPVAWASGLLIAVRKRAGIES